MVKTTVKRCKIQDSVERWSLDNQIRIGPSDPSFWALIDMIERLDLAGEPGPLKTVLEAKKG